ncbi:hypothetical protein ACLB2K_072065 [Fragaria x ananassa]
MDWHDWNRRWAALDENGLPEQVAAICKQQAEQAATREAAEEKEKAERNAFLEEFRQQWDALEKALQCLNVRPTIDEHVLAKKIELPSSQSNGENFPLDEPTSEEEITLSINDEEPEVEAVQIMDNHPISKTDCVPQKKELEDRTEQSILEKEIGSNTDDGDPQFHMKGDQGASFPMGDVYVDVLVKE